MAKNSGPTNSPPANLATLKSHIATALSVVIRNKSEAARKALSKCSHQAEIYIHLQNNQPNEHFYCYDPTRKFGISLNEKQCSVDTRKQEPQHLNLEELTSGFWFDKAELSERIDIARKLLERDPTKDAACLGKKVIFFFIPLSSYPNGSMDFYSKNPKLLFEATDFEVRFSSALSSSLDAMCEKYRKDVDLSAIRKLAECFIASIDANAEICFSAPELNHMCKERAFYVPEIHICFGNCSRQTYDFLHSAEGGEHSYSFITLYNGYLTVKEKHLHPLNFKFNNNNSAKQGDDKLMSKNLPVYYTNPNYRIGISAENFTACQNLRRKLIEILEAEQPIEALEAN